MRTAVRPAALTFILAVAAPAWAEEGASAANGRVSMETTAWCLLLGVSALGLNFAFTMAQTSMAALGPGALAGMKERGHQPAWLPRLASVEARLGLACLLMLLLCTFSLSMAGAGLMPLAPAVGAVAGVTVALAAHLIVVEVFARSLALMRADFWARFLVPVAAALTLPFRPLVALLGVGQGVRPAGEHPLALADMHLRLLPNLKAVERILDEDAFEMIDSVRDFAETTADQIMTPRTEVAGISRSMAADEVYDTLRKSPYSRLVVYQGDLDHVVGILLAKEVLLRRPQDPFALLRQPLFAPESIRLPELLQLIRTNRTHLVMIQDEYGGLSGVVTLHDLFERIVGHIEDVDDAEELWIQRVDETTLRVNGRVEVWELNEELGSNLDDDKARTVGGFVFNTLGRPAREGDVVEADGYALTVVTISENRVDEIRIQPIAKAESPEGGPA